jgi:hypothetical protein
MIIYFKFEKEYLTFQFIDRDKMKVVFERVMGINSSNDETEATRVLDECLKEINSILKNKGLK